MSDTRWIINDRHEVLPATTEITKRDDGRWYVDGQPGWFWENENLFDNPEDAKLRAIERVLGYALEHDSPPIHQEYVRTACAYAKEFRERIKELERDSERLRFALQDIVDRCEERDTGTGYYVEAGALALALHRVAKGALMPPDEETP